MTRLIAVIMLCTGIFCIAAEPPVGQSHAQVPMTGAGLGKPSSGGFTPSCTQSGTFLTAATGVTLTADKTNYDTLICGLVTDTYSGGGSIFAALDVLYIWAAPSVTNAALLNLVGPGGSFNGTANGTPSFSAYHGYTGDGSSFYIDTGFNPTTATSPNYAANSAHAGVYVLTADALGASFNTVGVAVNATIQLAPDFFGNVSWTINDTTASSVTNAATSQGQWVMTRTGSSSRSLYKNGNSTPFDTSTNAVVGVPNANVYFFAENNGSPADFASVQMSAGYIGKGLAAADQNKLTARINTFMTAYGINVY